MNMNDEQIQQSEAMETKVSQSEPQTETPEERLEELFQGLWERIRQSVELINELRSQKSSLEERVRELESHVLDREKELTEEKKRGLSREKDLKDLQEQAAKLDGKGLSNGERETLAAKAKELLGRIDEYL